MPSDPGLRTTGALTAELAGSPATRRGRRTGGAAGLEEILAGVLAGVMHTEQVPAGSHFFDELGADSLVMAHFCARVRKRGDLPPVSMKDIYAHPTISSLAVALADAAPVAARPPRPAPAEAAAPASTGRYVMCGVLQFLCFLGYAWIVALVGAWAYGWISDGSGLADIYLRAAVFGGAAFLVLCTVPILAKWVLIGRWKPQRIRIWSLGYVRFWIVKTLVRSNPLALRGRRLPAVRAVPARAGREDRAGNRDLLRPRAGVHRPAHHRRGHGDPQGRVLPVLPGRGGLDRDRRGDDRPGRVHRREDRPRHQLRRWATGRRSGTPPRCTAARPYPTASGGTGPRPSPPR